MKDNHVLLMYTGRLGHTLHVLYLLNHL